MVIATSRTDGTAADRACGCAAAGEREGSGRFARQADAGRFRRDVDLAGQRWPDGWVKGVGYATEEPAEPSLVEFGRGYVRD